VGAERIFDDVQFIIEHHFAQLSGIAKIFIFER